MHTQNQIQKFGDFNFIFFWWLKPLENQTSFKNFEIFYFAFGQNFATKNIGCFWPKLLATQQSLYLVQGGNWEPPWEKLSSAKRRKFGLCNFQNFFVGGNRVRSIPSYSHVLRAISYLWQSLRHVRDYLGRILVSTDDGFYMNRYTQQHVTW